MEIKVGEVDDAAAPDSKGNLTFENFNSASGQGQGQIHRRGTKRKNGFFSKAKKFGRQGKLGRGKEIPLETYTYFLNVFELCSKNSFETDEERDVFVENAFAQTHNEEVNLSSNQLTSRVLETLISLTKDEETLSRFTQAFTPSLRTVATDPFASHVLEKLLEVISEKWTGNKELTKWFRNTCKYALNNFEEFIPHLYANHVMRNVCQCLSETFRLFSLKGDQQNASVTRVSLPDLDKLRAVMDGDPDGTRHKKRKKNKKILEGFAQRFLAWPQFFDMFEDDRSSGFVQCLLLTLVPFKSNELILQGVLLVQKGIKKIDLNLKAHLHTFEVTLSLAAEDETIYRNLYLKYFKDNLMEFILHPYGHFTVERLFSTVSFKDIFEDMFDVVQGHFLEMYNSGHLSVFTKIADACRRLKARQVNLVTKLSELLEESLEHGKEPKYNFVDTLCRFGKTFPANPEGSSSYLTEMNGSLVLQALLDFHKPFKVVTGLISMEGLDVSKLAMDPKGSHVMDSFFKSSTVGDKNKELLLKKLQEHLVTMSCSKFGSRVLDNLCNISSSKQKTLIAAGLSSRISQLNANQYGKFLSQKCDLQLFNRDKKLWSTIMEKGLSNEKRKKSNNKEISTSGVSTDPTDDPCPKKKKKKHTFQHE